eukprot:4359526-Heterocapsa_arctica.AAC.1
MQGAARTMQRADSWHAAAQSFILDANAWRPSSPPPLDMEDIGPADVIRQGHFSGTATLSR